MTKYSNRSYDLLSTVPLCPFGEDQWNRILTYSPMYFNWTEFITVNPNQNRKHSPRKRNIITPIDLKAARMEDKHLLNQINALHRTATMSSLSRLSEKYSFNESKSREEERRQRPTSPTEEYQRSSDFFYQTRETEKIYTNHVQTLKSDQQQTIKNPLQPQQQKTNRNLPMRALTSIDLGPKPQTSLGVQLRQSAITREYAWAPPPPPEHRCASPRSISSGKRPIGSARSSDQAQQHRRLSNGQTSLENEALVNSGLYEQPTADSTGSVKQPCVRSTNTSRSAMYMIKTKADRAREKQNIDLKTILVKPCRPLRSTDNSIEDTIPNSIETMRKLGGPVSAFEKGLRHVYHKQLHEFRNGARKY